MVKDLTCVEQGRGFKSFRVSVIMTMSASRVYDKFDQMFSRLPNTDQVLLEEDKTLHFLKSVDMKDTQELGTLLEDDTQENGLVADSIAVKRACNRLDKRREWVDDTDLAGSTTESS